MSHALTSAPFSLTFTTQISLCFKNTEESDTLAGKRKNKQEKKNMPTAYLNAENPKKEDRNANVS